MVECAGYYSKEGIPSKQAAANTCTLCDEALSVIARPGEPAPPKPERVIKLTCSHAFHESCVRGWTIVGKKDLCPQCSEKVQLRELFASNPWEQGSVAWAQLLDLVRYLVVWQPILLIVSQVALYYAGFH